MSDPVPSALWVGDDPELAREVARHLTAAGACRLEVVPTERPLVLLLDAAGGEVPEGAIRLRILRSSYRAVPAIVFADLPPDADPTPWLEAGAVDVLPRTGFDPWLLLRAVEHAGALQKILAEVSRLERWDRTTRAFRRKATRRLRELRAEFERLTRAVAATLDQHILRVNHAAREFLAACAGLDPAARRHLDVIERARERMNHYYDAFQRLGGLDEPTGPPAPVDLGSLAREVVAIYLSEFESLGGAIEVGELPAIRGHRQRLFSLFANLVANSLKYRSNEPPRVEIRSRPEGDGVVIRVADNGVGISRSALHLGEGERAGDWATGLGIGLTICRRIVEGHGGSIELEADRPAGTCFEIRFPAGGPEAE